MSKQFIKGASKSLSGLVAGEKVRYKKNTKYMGIEDAPIKNEEVTIFGIYQTHIRFVEYVNLRVKIEDFSSHFTIMGEENEQGENEEEQ